MEFPTEIRSALANGGCEQREVFCDENSTETITGVSKRKYKLVFRPFEDLGYIIYVLNSNKNVSIRKSYQLVHQDMEWHDSSYLKKAHSYVDVSRPDFVSQDDVRLKRSDASNLFLMVGCISGDQLTEIDNFKHRVGELADTVDRMQALREMLDTVNDVEGEAADDLLNKLGLA